MVGNITMRDLKKFAFGIVTMTVTGGLQRDCIIIAQKLQALGHDVMIYCARQYGNLPPDLSVRILPNTHNTNHGRNFQFSDDFAAEVKSDYDCVVGFNEMRGLDIHYSGDPPIKPTFPLYHLLPRFQTRRYLEEQCFGRSSKTHNLFLCRQQALEYEKIWNTPQKRISVIPPNLEAARRHPELRDSRALIREKFGYGDNDWIWLSIATQPHTKGVDRTLRALKKCPNAKLILLGSPGINSSARYCAHLIAKLDLVRRVRWLGHLENVSEVMAAADLFVHPARVDTTGKIILEAVVNGLPVITTSICGYSHHIASASAGIVLGPSFSFREYLRAISIAESKEIRNDWAENGATYGQQNYLYTGFDYAVDKILKHARVRQDQPDEKTGVLQYRSRTRMGNPPRR